jgi:hypothetical protein
VYRQGRGKSFSEGEKVGSVSDEGVFISELRSKCQDLVQADILNPTMKPVLSHPNSSAISH